MVYLLLLLVITQQIHDKVLFLSLVDMIPPVIKGGIPAAV